MFLRVARHTNDLEKIEDFEINYVNYTILNIQLLQVNHQGVMWLK